MNKKRGYIALFMGYIHGILNDFWHIFIGLLDDLLVLAGVGIVIRMNFKIHPYFGWYSLGAVLIGLGIWIAFMRVRKHGG